MSAVFVGRERVMANLGARLADASEGRGNVAMLAGEAGIGKTAIVAGVADAPLASNALTVARMAALLGDEGEAGAWFARARNELEADGRRPLRDIVDHDEALALARRRSPDRARAAALLDDASSAFGTLGMGSWQREAQDLLAPLPDRLTAREAEVLGLLATGKTNKEIAGELALSPATVERHVANV